MIYRSKLDQAGLMFPMFGNKNTKKQNTSVLAIQSTHFRPMPVALYLWHPVFLPRVKPTTKSPKNPSPRMSHAAQAVTELPSPHGGGSEDSFLTEKGW